MVNFQPYYGAAYGMNPYGGYSPYGMSNPYGSSMGYSPYGSSMGSSPYGYNNPMQANMQSLAKGMTMILQNLPSLFGRNRQDSSQSQASSSKPDKAQANNEWSKQDGCKNCQ